MILPLTCGGGGGLWPRWPSARVVPLGVSACSVLPLRGVRMSVLHCLGCMATGGDDACSGCEAAAFARRDTTGDTVRRARLDRLRSYADRAAELAAFFDGSRPCQAVDPARGVVRRGCIMLAAWVRHAGEHRGGCTLPSEECHTCRFSSPRCPRGPLMMVARCQMVPESGVLCAPIECPDYYTCPLGGGSSEPWVSEWAGRDVKGMAL